MKRALLEHEAHMNSWQSCCHAVEAPLLSPYISGKSSALMDAVWLPYCAVRIANRQHL
jgi:hypothetical protein